MVARRAARCGAWGRTDEVRGGFRRGADLRDAAFLWLGFQLSRSKSRGVRKGPGEHAGALTWGATFAEAMVAIVNAALTRVCMRLRAVIMARGAPDDARRALFCRLRS